TLPPNLKHCTVNTKIEVEAKCQALGIPLKLFVMAQFSKKATLLTTLLNLRDFQRFLVAF
ncbi:TPA: hypothetical protein I7777_22735, partial [Vibrio vulnificus]|nr:hypothetical protein [Vibrio vulnificus]